MNANMGLWLGEQWITEILKQTANDEVFLSLLRKQEPMDTCLRRYNFIDEYLKLYNLFSYTDV